MYYSVGFSIVPRQCGHTEILVNVICLLDCFWSKSQSTDVTVIFLLKQLCNDRVIKSLSRSQLCIDCLYPELLRREKMLSEHS